MKRIFNFFLNTVYFLIIFVAAGTLASMAMVRKINSFRNVGGEVVLSVDKRDVVITNVSAGSIEKVYVNPGERVKAGDVLVSFDGDSLDAKVSVLEQFSGNNVSAQTQLEELKLEYEDLAIWAPKDGVIANVNVAEGSYVPKNVNILTMHADDDVKLESELTLNQIEEMQRLQKLEVVSTRLQQSFVVVFSGINPIQDEAGGENGYLATFRFDDASDGPAFIEGERLNVLGAAKKVGARPADVLVDLWNSLIIGA